MQRKILSDESMCLNKDCPFSQKCWRHENSGQVGNERQVFADFQPNIDGRCDNFIEQIPAQKENR